MDTQSVEAMASSAHEEFTRRSLPVSFGFGLVAHLLRGTFYDSAWGT